MAIEGNTQSFGVDELLQTVAMNRGGGKLEIQCLDFHQKKQGREFYFEQGSLRIVTFQKVPCLDFSTFIPRVGVIPPKQWEELCRRKPLNGEVLKEYVDEKVLQKLVERFYENELLEVLSWNNADFIYHPEVKWQEELGEVDPHLLVRMPIERTVMEVLRQLDELEVWKKQFPSLLDYYSLKEPPSQVVSRVKLDPLEKRVLKLLDGKHSLGQILKEVFIGQYYFYRLLSALREQNLLVKLGAEEIRKVADYWLELGEPERAVHALKQVIRLTGRDEAWQELVELYEDREDYGGLSETYFLWGQDLWRKGRKRAAVDKFRQSLRYRPSQREVQENLLAAYIDLEEWENAERVALGIVRDLERTKEWREAIRILHPLLEKLPHHADLNAKLGELYERIQNKKQAIAHYEIAAREYEAEGRLHLAKRMSQRIEKLKESSPKVQEEKKPLKEGFSLRLFLIAGLVVVAVLLVVMALWVL